MKKITPLICFILLSCASGPSGWHIASQGYINNQWQEVVQEPPFFVLYIDGVEVGRSQCLEHALMQCQVLANWGIKCRYMIYRVEDGKRYPVVKYGNYWEVRQWFEGR